MDGDDTASKSPNDHEPHKRRPRYSGTHPRKFSEKYKELDPATFPHLQKHVAAQGRTPAGTHIPVLVGEVMDLLHPQPGDAVVDCTLGYGGHALEFLRRIGPTGTFVGIDIDAKQLARTHERLLAATERLAADKEAASQWRSRIHLQRSHFAGLGKSMGSIGLSGFDIIFADLGVSSMQIDDPQRGFSYKHDGPLDMRMDDRIARTAADVVAAISADELAVALHELSDEPDARKITDAIVRRRAFRPITRTNQLVDVIFEVKGTTRRAWRERPESQRHLLHPAARTFQALRMLVNDEVAGLTQLLRIAPHCLRAGGRFGVISFHSKEDARVEQFFRDGLATGTYSAISQTPIRPTPAEVASNPRSRSAILRWAKVN